MRLIMCFMEWMDYYRKIWSFDEFVERSIYIKPEEVLTAPSDIMYLYERYQRKDRL